MIDDPATSARGQVTLLPIATGRRTWQASAALLREHPALLVATLASLLASGVAVVFVPALLGRLVDVVSAAGAPAAVDLIAVGLLVALLARALFTGLGQLLLARLGEQVLARLRERVVRRALDTPLDTVERSGHRRPGATHRRRHHGDLRGPPRRHPGRGHRADRRGADPGRAHRAGLAARPGRAGAAADLDPGHPLVPAHLRPALRRRADRRRGPDPEPGQQSDRGGDRTRLPAAGPPPAPDPGDVGRSRPGRDPGPHHVVAVRLSAERGRDGRCAVHPAGGLLPGPVRGDHPRRGDRGRLLLHPALQPR